ncbi:hypertrehalosaemic prohormone [Phlebotomus argentipes]|uniref:hypertrehalosaemic prohormone n=1 Tax=Phlebotomus argentipes TaxID=94469 RepID=UPI002892EDA8|nr:hypertrehalosaemic prohormone [Phlebotomus argentipes]
MTRLLILTVFLVSALLCIHAQLTFTPGWGKRSDSALRSSQGALTGENRVNVENLDSLVLLIYRMIQNEAQKLVDCNEK